MNISLLTALPSLGLHSAPSPHGLGIHGSACLCMFVCLMITAGETTPRGARRAVVQGERTSPAWEAAAKATRQI